MDLEEFRFGPFLVVGLKGFRALQVCWSYLGCNFAVYMFVRSLLIATLPSFIAYRCGGLCSGHFWVVHFGLVEVEDVLVCYCAIQGSVGGFLLLTVV